MNEKPKSIKVIFNTDVTVKKGTIFLGWMLAFFCGVVFAFMVNLMAFLG